MAAVATTDTGDAVALLVRTGLLFLRGVCLVRGELTFGDVLAAVAGDTEVFR